MFKIEITLSPMMQGGKGATGLKRAVEAATRSLASERMEGGGLKISAEAETMDLIQRAYRKACQSALSSGTEIIGIDIF